MAESAPDVLEIRFLLEKIESIIDSRLIGIDEPADDEIAVIREYEKDKGKGSARLNEI
jgi:hypothetical protein